MNSAQYTETVRVEIQKIETNVEQVIVGKKEVVRLALVTLLARGHLLIEDVPGVGKTTLARALAKSFDSSFCRIQFTSDLLPSDILGVSIYNKQKEGFEFHEGPIFANFILADEINRTTPKTQSCLLEAMNTGRISIDKQTYQLPVPFLVLATQNPVEYHGTYPLPNSQMDRFQMRIRMGYPSTEAEAEILRRGLSPDSVEGLEAVVTTKEVLHLQSQVPQVRVEDSLVNYITRIVEATREHRHIELGISPRGALNLQRAAQSHAFLEGRNYVTPDDIKKLALPVLAHRLILSYQNHPLEHTSLKSEEVLQDILDSIEVPL